MKPAALSLWLVVAFAAASLVLAEQPAQTKRLLLLEQKPDGHPPSTHEYLSGQRLLAELLSGRPRLEVSIASADEPWPEGPELIGRADGVVIFVSQGAKWVHQDPRRYDALAALAQRGGGISALHWGTGTRDAADVDGFLRLVGGCHGGPDRRYKVVEVDARLPTPDHPAVAGIAPFRVHDEFYYRLKLVHPAGSIVPLVQVPIEGGDQTVAWAWQRPDGGRSFGFTGLHFHRNWSLSEYRRLVAQGVLWTMGLPIAPEGIDADIDQRLLDADAPRPAAAPLAPPPAPSRS